MDIISINPNNIAEINRDYLRSGLTILYGAGGNGEKLLKVFKQNDVRVDLFCDDDFNKWGKLFNGIKVISYSDMLKAIGEPRSAETGGG